MSPASTSFYSPRHQTHILFPRVSGQPLRIQTPAAVFTLTGRPAQWVERYLDAQCAQALECLRLTDPALATLLEAMAASPRQPLRQRDALALGGFDTLFLEVTGQCNERCVHCYASAAPEVQEALSKTSCIRVLREAYALGFRRVQLTGGDPLLCGFIVELVEEAYRIGFGMVEVYTNGLLLKGALFERLRPLRPHIAMSIYGPDAATHDAVTQTPGSYVRTCRALRSCLEAGLSARVSVIVMPSNEDRLDETIETMRAIGIEAIHVTGTFSVGRGQHHRLRAAPADATSGEHGHARPSTAGAPPGGKLCVAYDGSVYPCIFNRRRRLGHIESQSLAEIVRGNDRPAGRLISALGSTIDSGQELECASCRLTDWGLQSRLAAAAKGDVHALSKAGAGRRIA